MSVHQKKDGRWICQYRDKKTKKLKTEYFGRGPEGEKRAWERNEELDLNPYTRRVPASSEKTFDELAQAYLQAKQADNEESTVSRLKYRLGGPILDLIGDNSVLRLTPHRMDQYVAKRLRGRKVFGKGDKKGRLVIPKKTTIHREISDIQAILNWSVKRGYIRYNPLAAYEKPKRDDEVILPPTQAETKALFRHAPPHLVRALSLSYYTGLRPGLQELLRITWSDIDWDQGLIIVRSARRKGPPVRRIPIHEHFLDILNKWHKKDGYPASGEIITYKGKPIKRISKSFTRSKERAGISRRLPPYAFRHAFATYSLEADADLKSTSEILGHARIDTTTRIYQHTNLTLHRKSINKLPILDVPEEE